jgi:hypothetical protein
MNIIICSQIIIFCFIFIHLIVETNAFRSHNKFRLHTKLGLKINSDSDGKIKYTTDLNHLNNYDLTNIYTIIGSKNDTKCNNLIKRIGQINKKFVFIDKALFEQNNIDHLILYFSDKHKINLKNIEQPWLFFEYRYILNDEVYSHLL